MQKLHLLHLAESAGGVDRYLRMLLTYMDRNRFEQSVALADGFREEDYQGLADRFIRVRMRHELRPGADAGAIGEVRRIVRNLKPDLVYCHSSKAGGIGRLACMGLGVRVVYNPHGWAFDMKVSKPRRWAYLAMERALAPLTCRYVVISNHEKLAAIVHHIAHERRVCVIYNGVDVEALRRTPPSAISRRSLGIAPEAYLTGMVGRISPQKAPDVFVDMAERVGAEIPHAHFLIVGDGEMRGDIERMIAARGLEDRFTITGWVDDAAPYIALMDQAVMLSRWEGFGLVIAEFMAKRKPVVATEVGAIPELITDHDNGLLVPPDNAERAAEAVMEFYNNPDMRKELVDKAEMRTLAFFDVKRTAMEHERLFVKLCKEGGVILSEERREKSEELREKREELREKCEELIFLPADSFEERRAA